MASTAAARRPSFEKKRSSSNINLAANDDETHSSGHPRHHKAKQFVVHAGRHHTRVPSYGRNLNKLSKLTLAHHGDGAPATKGLQLERGGSNGRKSIKGGGVGGGGGGGAGAGAGAGGGEGGQATTATEERRKKPAFEIGDSDEDTANEEEITTVETKPSPVKKPNGLKKSSSTKSLERTRREASRGERAERTVPHEVSKEKREVTIQLRKQTPALQNQAPIAASERTLVDMPRKIDVSGETYVNNDLPGPGGRLFGQVVNTAAAPPQLNADYATGLHTPVSSNGGSTAFPNNQALTSRFMDSPGRAGVSASVSPGYTHNDVPRANGKSRQTSMRTSTQSSPPTASNSATGPQKSSLSGAGSSTTSIPSRTQQKLWLQRQFDEDAQLVSSKKQSQGGNNSWTSISQRELERTTREYYNVRRFKDPIGEALDRIRDHPKLQRRIPRKGQNGSVQEAGMGLSQSLGAATGAGIGKAAKNQQEGHKGLKGSRDDSGIGTDRSEEDEEGGMQFQRDPNLQNMLNQLWNQPLLISNE
ncbi:hypothetical protein BDZ91DRAFT_39370 [Kalaharituber pfeilii]|nr:hypothetical protein BDZ91DRAFT_39370 [Kalaharituber pfeilii]